VPEPDVARARWLEPSRRSHYESYYVEAVRPGGGRAVWIRCTVERSPGGTATGEVWVAFVDEGRPGPVALREPGLAPDSGHAAWIRCGTSEFGPSGTWGSLSAGGTEAASWDLTFAGAEPAFLHLPRAWMYEARLPRTKLASLVPGLTLDGRLTVAGEVVDVRGWRGVVGHNWGEEHAEQWLWLHGVVADGPFSGAWIDLAAARIRVGGVLLPWTAFGALSLGRERLRLGGLGRRLTVRASPTDCSLVITGRGIKVSVAARAGADSLVRWDYTDPSGPRHPVSNGPTADLRLRVVRPGRDQVDLRLDGSATYEHGGASR
jgi:hypothetical protein